MPSYKTPGMYIEEISKFPPSVVPVETAVPAFIGFTEKAVGEIGESLTNTPTRITSLLEYEQFFGGAQVKALSVDVTETAGAIGVKFETAPGLPSTFLYHSMQLFFANGGGPCYVVSVGDYAAAGAASKAQF